MGDESLAEHYLNNISYYRLAGYWWPMQADKVNHLFKTNSRFEDVVALYSFDSELRLLLFNAIERIEIGLRTRNASSLGQAYVIFSCSTKSFKYLLFCFSKIYN